MKDNKEDIKRLECGLLEGMKQGFVAVPQLLLTQYAQLGLADTEAMLLIHLLSFTDKEKKDFPTIEEIQERMSAEAEEVIRILQRLMKDGWIGIDEETDPVSSIRFERYNLGGMKEKLAGRWAQELAKRFVPEKTVRDSSKNIFLIFEKEFARPLTPMELETISGWLDQDRFQEELILAALKEAVFAGKVHFRYIDRILLEWQRNRILTAAQAKEHAQKFRSR